MSRRHAAEKREVLPDAKYGDVVLTKFMNNLMIDGKKSVAERIVYGAIDNIADRRKIPSEQAVDVLEQALDVFPGLLLVEVVEEIGLKELGERDRYVFYRPVPTEANPNGYHGRTSILELLAMTDPIRRMVMRHATSGEIQDLAVSEGMRTMYFDGLNKCLAGVTTLEEVLRVTQDA